MMMMMMSPMFSVEELGMYACSMLAPRVMC